MFRPLPRDWAEVREYDTKCQRATFRCVFASMFTQPGPSWTELGPTHLAEDSSNIHKAPSCATFYLFSDLISFSSSFFRGVSKWESDEIKENLSKSVTICRPDLGQNTWMRQKKGKYRKQELFWPPFLTGLRWVVLCVVGARDNLLIAHPPIFHG